MRTRAWLALAATLVALLIAACGVGGWVVLPDGTERGAVRRYETPLMPGEVDPTTFRPGDATFAVPGGALRPELVRPSDNLSLPS